MKKILFKFFKAATLAGLVIAGTFNIAEAETVTVDGVGTDRESALKSARRLAVEQVVGVLVDSRTLVNNGMMELDNIYSKSNGFIGKIEILHEGMDNGLYKIQARIDVDKNPSPEILQQVQAVVALNDPRIAVVILKENFSIHEDSIESAIMDSLISRNFTHMIDPSIVSSLHNAQMLENLYNGRPVKDIGSSLGADFIVLGKCRTNSKDIKIPDFKGGYLNTGLNSGKTEMTVKIIRLDTGDILETFNVETTGVDEGNSTAEREAVKNMANQAASKVDEKFRRIGARSSKGIQITINSKDYDKIQKFANDIRDINGVQNVYIREHRNGKAIVEVDTDQNIETLLLLLRSRSSVDFVVESTGGSSAVLSV